MPDDAKVSLPVLALAWAMSSWTDFAGEEFGTTRRLGKWQIMRHRREVGDRIVAERGVEEAIDRHRQRADQDGVAVGLGARDRLGADIAAGAALVLDHHLLAPDLGQPVGEDARDHVGSAAGRKRHDQSDMTVGPALRPGSADEGGRECCGRTKPGHLAAGEHLRSSLAAFVAIQATAPGLQRQSPSSTEASLCRAIAAGQPGSRACFLKTAAAAGAVMKLTSAFAASACLAPA